eukprot:2858823-Rhodomonas_salina.2
MSGSGTDPLDRDLDVLLDDLLDSDLDLLLHNLVDLHANLPVDNTLDGNLRNTAIVNTGWSILPARCAGLHARSSVRALVVVRTAAPLTSLMTSFSMMRSTGTCAHDRRLSVRNAKETEQGKQRRCNHVHNLHETHLNLLDHHLLDRHGDLLVHKLRQLKQWSVGAAHTENLVDFATLQNNERI